MPDRQKVVWSSAERDLIIACGVELSLERHDLSGLRLARTAMRRALPKDRHRAIHRMTDVPWFEERMAQEARNRQAVLLSIEQKRHSDAQTDGRLVELIESLADSMRRQADALDGHSKTNEGFMAEHARFKEMNQHACAQIEQVTVLQQELLSMMSSVVESGTKQSQAMNDRLAAVLDRIADRLDC